MVGSAIIARVSIPTQELSELAARQEKTASLFRKNLYPLPCAVPLRLAPWLTALLVFSFASNELELFPALVQL